MKTARYRTLAEAQFRVTGNELQLVNPRWLCGCGAEYDVLTHRAYPICTECGLRCRFVTADNLPYVDQQEART